MDKTNDNGKKAHWNDNGKGESWRKGDDIEKFRANYDRIFRKNEAKISRTKKK